MEVTTREHLLFCTTCLFSFYYRRRSFCLLACTKRGEGCLSAACDDCQSVIHSWTEFVLFVKHRFYYLCCSSSHHSPLLLMCFFLFFAGRLFWLFCLFFFAPPPPIARRPRCRINDFRRGTSAVTAGASANKTRPPFTKTISVLCPATGMTVTRTAVLQFFFSSSPGPRYARREKSGPGGACLGWKPKPKKKSVYITTKIWSARFIAVIPRWGQGFTSKKQATHKRSLRKKEKKKN